MEELRPVVGKCCQHWVDLQFVATTKKYISSISKIIAPFMVLSAKADGSKMRSYINPHQKISSGESRTNSRVTCGFSLPGGYFD